ncbi:hypothetical protein [Bifidobacterium boum]|uniref:hypothetical protein n=1 Tax=Bifidobacterium boum TaxID=78343 RepID=UPI003F925FA5
MSKTKSISVNKTILNTPILSACSDQLTMPYHLLFEDAPRQCWRVDAIRDTAQAAVSRHGLDIAVGVVGHGKQTGKDGIASRYITSVQNCQAVCLSIAVILSSDLLVAQFLAQTAHIAQSARPNQGLTPFRGLVIFTRQALDLLQRQAVSR